MKKMTKTNKITLAIALILVFGSLLSACAAKAEHDSLTNNEAYDSISPNAPAEVPSTDGSYGYDYMYSGKGESADDTATGGTVTGDAAQMSEKIIRNVSIEAQTKEYDIAVERIRSQVVLLGGFEENFRSSGKNYYNGNNIYSRYAYMVLRLPADQLDAFLSEVGGMVNILSQNSNAQNVTSEYYDIKARISVLESERAAYEEMLKQSMEIKELLEIKDRLYDVIAEIESYQTRLNLLDSKVAYSTVTISLNEVVEYTPVITAEPTFGERVGKAFTESWKSFAKGCQNFAVWFVYALPTILILAAVAVAVIVVVLKLNRKHRRPAVNKKEAEDNKPSDK